ncbi:bacterioferritin-associated ferredoxin [Marinimicrobium agarilyticum]|uniref:bacterioferritin-associated ferredoxin n=1 Tax=Marinimicrobium agarilyticum TaxID=306546 RepID=UPI000423E03D|nr:bacterioferritin-associated ferredoxin [Marinimicrobium agarilyticum]
MYVCVCKGITDHQIKDAVYAGATTVGKLRKALGVASQCGKCTCLTRELIDETLQTTQHADAEPLYYAVAV